MIDFITSISPDVLILSIGGLVLCFLLTVWHLSSKETFDIKDLFCDETGKFSLNKTGQFIALLTSTWIIIYQTRHNLLQDWLFTTYMLAWAGANLTSKFLDQRNNRLSTKEENDQLNIPTKDNI